MTKSTKIAIALAVAIPLVLVGGGFVVAGEQFGCCRDGDGSLLPQFNTQRDRVSTLLPDVCDDCTGDCSVQSRECAKQSLCAAQCVSACNSDCVNEEKCGSGCGRAVGNQAGACFAQCGKEATEQQVSSSEGETSWWGNDATIDFSDRGSCDSCDVAGLNEYPPTSPHYTGGD